MLASPQFDDHVHWLRSLRTQYEQQVVSFERTPSSQPVGFGTSPFASPSSSPRSQASPSADIAAAAAALPEAPMAWGHADELDEDALGYGYGSLSIDDAEPVYRSIGSIMASAEFVDDPSYVDDFEAPPTRGGLSDAFASLSSDVGIDEESESKWLQKMPPLIRRQKGGQLRAPC